MRKRLYNQSGMTLIELLLAMAIGSIVAMAAYSVFFSSTRTARQQELAAEIQQNLRVAMERLTQDIRQAGFGLPEDGSSLVYNSGTWSAPVTAINSSSAPDSITLLGVGYKIGSTYNVVGKAISINPDFNGDDEISGFMETRFANASTDESGDLNNTYVEKFLEGIALIPFRRHLSIGGVEYLEAEGFSDNGKQIGVTPPASNEYANNIPVFILQAVTYSIRPDCYPDDSAQNFPCLVSNDASKLRGGGDQIVAEGIEDIQFAYGVDVSPRDGKVDYSPTGYNSADFVSDPVDDSSIVAVRVSIVARSKQPEQQGGSARPALEDRPAGTADKYIRRTLTKTIKLRNPRSGA